MNESRHICETCVFAILHVSRCTHIIGSCHAYGPVTPHICTSHVSHMNESHHTFETCVLMPFTCDERWGAGVETQKNVWGEIGGWGRVPFNEPYAPSLSTIYDGA